MKGKRKTKLTCQEEGMMVLVECQGTLYLYKIKYKNHY